MIKKYNMTLPFQFGPAPGLVFNRPIHPSVLLTPQQIAQYQAAVEAHNAQAEHHHNILQTIEDHTAIHPEQNHLYADLHRTHRTLFNKHVHLEGHYWTLLNNHNTQLAQLNNR